MSRRAFLGGLAMGAALLTACGGEVPEPGVELDRRRVAYGSHPRQQGDLTAPRSGDPAPVLVLIHGGYWKPGMDRQILAPLGESLSRLGYAVWNIDYRTIGADGGGWPETFDDVATAIDFLASVAHSSRLDLDRVVTVGHSAGGHLALWSAARGRAPERATRPDAPGSSLRPRPVVPVTGVLSIAGVPDLVAAASTTAGGNVGELRQAVTELLGGTPEAVPERYAAASPRRLLPLGVPQLLIHGDRDDRVPIDQARTYAAAATAAGDPARLLEVPGGDHGDVARAESPARPALVSWLGDTIHPQRTSP
jgi:acetyl esterase/lipase